MRSRFGPRGLLALLAGSAALTGALVVPTAGASEPGRSGESCAPTVTGARPSTVVQQLWTWFGDRAKQGEWAGADGSYSTPLPDGRTAWLFNDTFVGPVGPGRSITPHPPVHNTIVTAYGRANLPIETIREGTAANPLPLVGPAGTERPWYWNGDGIVDAGKLYVFEFQQRTAGEGHFGFEWIGTDLASLSLRDLKLERVQPTYDSRGIQWGVELVKSDGYLYIYGVGPAEIGKQAYLARARVGGLAGAWEFYTGSGWSPREQAAAPIVGDVGSSFGVAKVGEQYLLLSTDSFLGSEIYLRSSETPFGFADAPRRQIYDTPEGQPEYDADAAGDIYTYNVAVHPTLSTRNKLVFSYNVNSTAIEDLFGDIANNRARYVDLRFAPPPRPCR